MSREYDLYLEKHKENVRKAFQWLKTNLPELFEGSPSSEWQTVFDHDHSKSNDDEYGVYDAYFYGGNRSYAVVQAFDKAWLLHIHRNPHHWQYWVLNGDDPDKGEIVLEMPYNYIVEMICDWWSFSWMNGNLAEIFDWYDEHQAYIKFNPKTRQTVEDILWKLRGRLGYNVIAHHSIKGQKWGVKNGPPYPLDRSRRGDKIVKDAIESGLVSIKVNREKQLRHTLKEHTPGRSYINGDLEYAQELIDRHSGSGEAKLDRNGTWNHRERITADHDIGVYVDESGKETNSNIGMIIYSSTGTHIYPAQKKRRISEMKLNKKLEGCRVKIICMDGEIFEGTVTDYIYPEDNEPEEVAAIDIENCPQIPGRSIAFNEHEIKSIDIIE